MTKAVSHAQRRKRKGTKRDHEAVMEVVHATPAKPVEDPRIVVLSARCRQMGKEDTRANRSMLSWPILGDPAGLAISIASRDDDEAGKLWAVFCAYDAAHAAYHRRIIGKPRSPNVSRMEFLPERFETREDDSIDSRTEDEKDRDAVNGMDRWSRMVATMPKRERIALRVGVWLLADLTRGTRCTTAGLRFVHALRDLRDIAERG